MFYILYLIIISELSCSQKVTQEQRLFRYLLSYYEPSIRPVSDFQVATNIHIKMKLVQILDLSEKERVLTTTIWIEQVTINSLLIEKFNYANRLDLF
jgi:hypothetical protein